MSIVKSKDGFVSLRVNLDGRWEQPFASFPDELQAILQPRRIGLQNWDELTPEERRRRAASYDHESDPALESGMFFELDTYRDELTKKIDTARTNSEHAIHATLQDVVAQIDKILYLDRGRVGAEIQRLRAIDVNSQNTNGREHVSDRLAIMQQAAFNFWANADRTDKATHPSNATVAQWIESRGQQQSFSKHAASYIRPSWAAAGRKPEEV